MIAESWPFEHQRCNRVELLVVNPFEDERRALREVFRHSNWSVYEASSCAEAIAKLIKFHIPVVICESTAPEGGWKTLLPVVDTLPARPRMIVSSRLADERLWGEVLNVGGDDVLAVPFDAREVLRVCFLAWHSSRNEVLRMARAVKASKSKSQAASAAGAAD